jgi:HEAT repeat protein
VHRSREAQGNRDPRRVAAVAGHSGDEHEARSLLQDPDPFVRATAIGALARMGALTSTDLATALGDGEPVVRRRACEEAGNHPTIAVELLDALDDSDTSVVEAACWAVGERGDAAGKRAVETLATVATTHDEALCREAAVAALGAIGDDAGLPAILAATGDKPAVRRRAVLALAPFEGADVDAALQRALDDRDWQVRQAAEDLLA